MNSQHIPMSIEEFELMPWKLGLKYEYWNGKAHISPRHHFVTTSINIKPRPVQSPCKIRPVEKEDEPQLISAYLAAFSDTIEYCDWKPEQIEESARKNIQDFLAGKRGKPLSSSRLVVLSQFENEKEFITGAALFVKTKSGQTLLDMLFTIPAWQRKGLATTLVSAAINEFLYMGIKTLVSRYHPGNDKSKTWHEKFGFEEVPDLSLARLYYHHANNELWRRDKIGDIDKSEREKLLSEVNQWKLRVEELEQMAKRNRDLQNRKNCHFERSEKSG